MLFTWTRNVPNRLLYDKLQKGKRSAGAQWKRYKDTRKVSLNNFNIDPDISGRISWWWTQLAKSHGEGSCQLWRKLSDQSWEWAKTAQDVLCQLLVNATLCLCWLWRHISHCSWTVQSQENSLILPAICQKLGAQWRITNSIVCLARPVWCDRGLNKSKEAWRQSQSTADQGRCDHSVGSWTHGHSRHWSSQQGGQRCCNNNKQFYTASLTGSCFELCE